MEKSIIEFGKKESIRLEKEITLCQDENFHPEISLIAIKLDASSTLFKKYYGSRKGVDGTETMQDAIKNLLAEIIQSISKKGKSKLHHVKKLMLSCLRPHHEISQKKPLFYLGLLKFTHNVDRRRKAMFHSLIIWIAGQISP